MWLPNQRPSEDKIRNVARLRVFGIHVYPNSPTVVTFHQPRIIRRIEFPLRIALRAPFGGSACIGFGLVRNAAMHRVLSFFRIQLYFDYFELRSRLRHVSVSFLVKFTFASSTIAPVHSRWELVRSACPPPSPPDRPSDIARVFNIVEASAARETVYFMQ